MIFNFSRRRSKPVHRISGPSRRSCYRIHYRDNAQGKRNWTYRKSASRGCYFSRTERSEEICSSARSSYDEWRTEESSQSFRRSKICFKLNKCVDKKFPILLIEKNFLINVSDKKLLSFCFLKLNDYISMPSSSSTLVELLRDDVANFEETRMLLLFWSNLLPSPRWILYLKIIKISQKMRTKNSDRQLTFQLLSYHPNPKSFRHLLPSASESQNHSSK